MLKRRVFLFATVLGMTLPFQIAQAQNWPERPIKFVVSASAGNTADINARVLAAELEKQLKQPVVVENKPGGGGVIGLTSVIRSAPDGYTIGFGNLATLAINPSLIKNLKYNVEKDLIPVAQYSYTSNLLVVRPGLGVKNFEELVALIKSKPPKSLTMGSLGIGTTGHLGQALLEQTLGLDMTHVPYKAATQAHPDLLGDRLDIMFDNIASVMPHVQAGSLKALAFTGEKRSPIFPDIPTMEELGLKGFVMTSWAGVVVPAGTPKPIVERLNKEINTALKSKTLMDAYAKLSGNPAPQNTPEQFAQLIKAETDKWGVVIKKAGVSLEE